MSAPGFWVDELNPPAEMVRAKLFSFQSKRKSLLDPGMYA